MRRLPRFAISKRPYAIEMGSLRRKVYAGEEGPWVVGAVWFRRRRGETVACFGELCDYQDPAPGTGIEFARRNTNGWYGGTAVSRWDGDNLWTTVDLATSQKHLQILQPMLANYPAPPAGFDAWWTFL